MTSSPLLGAVVGATVGLGVVLAVAGWFGLLDRPPTTTATAERTGATTSCCAAPCSSSARASRGSGRGWPVAAAAAGLAGWLAPTFVGLRARRRRQLARSEAIAIWAEMLRDLLVSNAGLHEAIGKSARVAPDVIRDEVRALYVRAQRGDLSAALVRFAADMDDAIADTVVTALQIAEQRAVSDLGELLGAVATSTRETVAMQLRINATRARTYRTAQLIAGVVAFFVGVLVVTNRTYMAPFGTFTGQLVLIGVCVGGGQRPVGHGRALAAGARRTAAARRTARGDGVIWAALLGAMLAAGCWLVARALVPPARSLRVLAGRARGAPPAGRRPHGDDVRPAPAMGRPRGAARGVGRRSGSPPTSPCSAARPCGTRSTSSATACCSSRSPLVPTVLFPALDVDAPLLATGIGALLFGAAGWTYPDVEVRSRALATRRAWSRALTVYVDIVGISLAGGAGVEDALMVAARAGSGPQFAQLDAALRAAQTRRQKLWHALDELGRRGDIRSLRELAAAVDLAAESGSRIRETLLAKANALRVRQLTEAEAEAQKASETMGVAPALMAIAAVVLIGYPALARFLSG